MMTRSKSAAKQHLLEVQSQKLFKKSQKSLPKTIEKKNQSLKLKLKETPQKNVIEYIDIIDPRTDTIKKYPVFSDTQKITITRKKLELEQLIPPHLNCDEDYDSNDEVIQEGKKRTVNDLMTAIQKREHMKKMYDKFNLKKASQSSGYNTDADASKSKFKSQKNTKK